MAALTAVAAGAHREMTLEKYLTDLHTGKLFGDLFWPLYDLTAIAIVLFVGTGLYIWIYPTLAKRRKRRRAAVPGRPARKGRPVQAAHP